MFQYGIALIFALAAGKADPVDMARKSFNNCMIELHNSSVDVKKSVSDFNKSVSESCVKERAAYHELTVKSERAFGSNANDAAKYADEEVQNVISGVTASFAENVKAGQKLGLEK
jgi:hypothetical protein